MLPGTVVEVLDDAGDPVDGLGRATLSDDGRVAQVAFEPLDAGGYVVEYEFTAEDGDTQQEAYRFTVTADGAAAGPSAVDIVGVVVVVLVILAAAAIALRRRRN